MKMLRLFAVCLFVSIPLLGLFPDTILIPQIDNNTLLINQTVKAYVSASDSTGQPIENLTKDNFSIFESSETSPEEERRIISCEQGVNITRGINFMLVIDNSGSMYYDASGRITESEDEKIWRITHAKNAVVSFLAEIKNPLDRIGMESFNVKTGAKVAPTKDKIEIEKALKKISKPAKEEAYTELYEALYHSVDTLRTSSGRKVIILLSDGEDFPLKDNPFITKRYGLEGAVEFAQKEGISIFTIGLSEGADNKTLKAIAGETGGKHFSIYNPQQLGQLYNLIRSQVLGEYLLTFVAGMDPSEKKLVRVVYKRENNKAEAKRTYYSATMFGLPQDIMNWLIFLILPVAALLLWILSLIRFEKKKEDASLDILTIAGKKKKAPSMTIVGKNKEITIGGSANSDLTIQGDPKVTMMEAKINKRGDSFTIASMGSPITVNNRPIKTKVLRSGDLIKVGDTTIVFDGGVKKTVIQKKK